MPGWRLRCPRGVIHGDAHRGNLLCQDGEAVLLDFEEFRGAS